MRKPTNFDEKMSSVGTPQRGRPRSVEKNKKILEAAAELFLEKGFEATNVDDVARAAGVSKQTVYSHFDNKETLFKEAIASRWSEVFCADLMDGLHLPDPDEALLKTALDFGRALLSPDSVGLYRILVSTAAKNPELSRSFWEAQPRFIFDAIYTCFEAWQKKGIYQFDDLAEATFDFSLLIRGDLHYRLAIGLSEGSTAESLDAQIRRGVEKFKRIYKVGRGEELGGTSAESAS